MTLAPFSSESSRLRRGGRRPASGDRAAEPSEPAYGDFSYGDAPAVPTVEPGSDDPEVIHDVPAPTDHDEPVDADGLAPRDRPGGHDDDLIISDEQIDLWELEGRFAGPSADPTPPRMPQPPLAEGETTQHLAGGETSRHLAGAKTSRHLAGAKTSRRRPERQRPQGRPARRPTAVRRPPRKPASVVRIGLLWAIVLGLATGLAPPLAAVLLVPVTAVAAQSAWRRLDPATPEPWWLPAVAAGACPLVALFGPVAALVAVVLASVGTAALTGQGAPTSHRIQLGISVAAPAAGAASLIAACTLSPTIGLALLAAVCLFDASNFIMGTGETGGALGALAGVVTLGVLALLLAGLFVVPFGGASPWILCGAVAITAPLSVGMAHGFAGRMSLPAWRRLDSLFLAGPVWVVLATILLPH